MHKLEKLKEMLSDFQSAVIAFSGGVDSTFILKIAHDVLFENVVAVTANSESYACGEMDDAKRIASELKVKHIIIQTNEMHDDAFLNNPPNRCYFCKQELFTKLKAIAVQMGIPHVLDGSNADDADDYRPGMQALRELGIKSPLQEVGFTKAEIRALSKDLGLSTWDKPALACLASRVPYGSRITAARLNRIDKAEAFLRDRGITHVRVRDHDRIARIEISSEHRQRFFEPEFIDAVVNFIKDLGFQYVTLDLEGYRTGSLNEVL